MRGMGLYSNYEACKKWALSQVFYDNDIVSCSKNCDKALDDSTPVCEIVVRNIAPLPVSYTFDSYKE